MLSGTQDVSLYFFLQSPLCCPRLLVQDTTHHNCIPDKSEGKASPTHPMKITNCFLASLGRDEMAVYLWVYFWTYSVPLMYHLSLGQYHTVLIAEAL